MRVVLDAARCASTGMCEAAAPAHFAVREDGALLLVQDGLAGEVDRAALERAVARCPTGALRLRG